MLQINRCVRCGDKTRKRSKALKAKSAGRFVSKHYCTECYNTVYDWVSNNYKLNRRRKVETHV